MPLAPTVLILAAGEGTRMKSAVPKVLHPVCGRPMVTWVVEAALGAGAGRVVVVDNPKRRLQDAMPAGVEVAVQEQPLGTGDAVRSAAAHIERDVAAVVLYGDVPLITAEAIRTLLAAHAASGAAATMATMELDDPTGYGRVVRGADGSVERVVETKVAGDATDAELAIREVNTGIFAFDGGRLLDALARVTPDNAQGELYLPDVLPVLRSDGDAVAAHLVSDPSLALGVNDRVDLADVTRLAQRRILERHMRDGVTFRAPDATVVDADVGIGRDTVVEAGACLHGRTVIGEGAVIGPHTTLIDTTVGDAAKVVQSYATGAEIGPRALVGPFAYLRPAARLESGAKAGTFVEVENSVIVEGAKVPHLSYIGDAEIGPGANLGAGTITANYDGTHKHRTTVGARVRGGVHTSLVAPVTVGDDAYTAAGSVITKDVPAGALGVARERQRNVEGYAERRKQQGSDTGS